MAGRSPARFLAPIALIIFAFVLFNVVSSDEEPTSTTPAKQTATATPSESSSDEEKDASEEEEPKTKTYTVKPGDTASAIAEEAGMDLQTLLELNPDVDASSLSPGQKIVLER